MGPSALLPAAGSSLIRPNGEDEVLGTQDVRSINFEAVPLKSQTRSSS